MKYLLIILLCLFPFIAEATMMTDFTEDSSPTSDDIFWTTNAPATAPTDRKVTLANLLLWMATQNWTTTGTWDFSGATVTGVQNDLSLVKGTYTNGYWCKYTATGTLLDCTVNPALYPTLAGDNTFTGTNTFTDTVFSASVTFGSGTGILANTGGTVSTETSISTASLSNFTASRVACTDVSGVLTTCDMPAAQTIAEGDTIAADACGTLKQITAAGAVTTNTTNTFTAPAAANTGCCMDVVNVGGETITLDNNALFVSAGAANVVMTANDSVRVCSNGTKWYQISALLAN